MTQDRTILADRRLWHLSCVALLSAMPVPALAHNSSGSGLLHPLTGVDHLTAMVAVGAWSAQIGGRAIWIVPSAFVCFMLAGAAVGFNLIDIPGSEIAIALSVLVLGLAIALDSRMPVVVAAPIVGLFGFFHGYAHGYEMSVVEDRLSFVGGFTATTAMLHIIGAVGAWFMLKKPNGDYWLRGAGAIASLIGVWLVLGAV